MNNQDDQFAAHGQSSQTSNTFLWESMPTQEILQEIGSALNQDEYRSFVQRMYQWVKDSAGIFGDEEISPDDTNKLSDIINIIIDSNPNLFLELKSAIETIFQDNEQFVIPQ